MKKAEIENVVKELSKNATELPGFIKIPTQKELEETERIINKIIQAS